MTTGKNTPNTRAIGRPRPKNSNRWAFTATGADAFGHLLINLALVLLTFGLYLPFRAAARRKWLTQHTRVHGAQMRYSAPLGESVAMWLISKGLTFITLGLYLPWAIADRERFYWRHVRLTDGRKCRFTGTGGDLLGIILFSALVIVCTLGLGTPWTRYTIEVWKRRHVTVGGEPVRFNGYFGDYFFRSLGSVLCVFTLGIYLPFHLVNMQSWWARASRCELPENHNAEPPK